MSDPAEIHIEQVPVDRVIDLRWRLLRAGLGRETACFEGDDEPTTLHFAAISQARVVGCVTILRRAWNDRPAWQLRGMAVETGLQGKGVGEELLKTVEGRVRYSGHSLQLWCNARTPATGFYRKFGWELVGEEFVIPTAGPHFKMSKLLTGPLRV